MTLSRVMSGAVLSAVLCGGAMAQTTRPAAETPTAQTPSTSDATPRRSAEVRLEGAPLKQAVEAFANATKVSVYANWRRLENEGIDPNTPISLRVQGITYGKLLQLMLESASPRLRYTVSEGVITIYAVPEAQADPNRPAMVSRVYDITDLMHVIPDLASPGNSNTGNTNNTAQRTSRRNTNN